MEDAGETHTVECLFPRRKLYQLWVEICQHGLYYAPYPKCGAYACHTAFMGPWGQLSYCTFRHASKTAAHCIKGLKHNSIIQAMLTYLYPKLVEFPPRKKTLDSVRFTSVLHLPLEG